MVVILIRFGGDLNVQSSFYMVGILIVFSALMGITNAKRSTTKHRKWMLRELCVFHLTLSGDKMNTLQELWHLQLHRLLHA